MPMIEHNNVSNEVYYKIIDIYGREKSMYKILRFAICAKLSETGPIYKTFTWCNIKV